jgi:hypothetical protein
MSFSVKSEQRAPRIEAFSSSATALTEGIYRGTFSTGGTGIYTITFAAPFARTPVVTATAFHATLSLKCIITAKSASAVTITVRNDSGAATAPTSFDLVAIGSDVADQY